MTVAPFLDADQEQILAAMLDISVRRILVESPPGSGKTYAAVTCAAAAGPKLLTGNQRILILTFSDAARMQLEQYARQHLGPERTWAPWLEITNYHAFFLKYVWAYRIRLGLPPGLRIDSPGSRAAFIANLTTAVAGSTKLTEPLSAALDLRIPEVGASTALTDLPREKLDAIQEAILERNRQQLLGYDDFAFHFWSLLDRDTGLLSVLRRKYPLLMLDEYQDVSDAQSVLSELLLGACGRAVIFADEMQCIHEWRGARADRVKQVRSTGCREIRLTTLHRYKDAQDLRNVLSAARRRLSDVETNSIPLVDDVLEIRRPKDVRSPLGPIFEARAIADRERRRPGVTSVAVICHTKRAVEECRRHFHKYFVFTRPGHVLDLIHDCLAGLIDDLHTEEPRTADGSLRVVASILEGDEDFGQVRKNPTAGFRCERRKAIAACLRSVELDRPVAMQLARLVGSIEQLPRCEHRMEINYEALEVLRRAGRVCHEGQSTSETASELTKVFLQSQHLIRRREPRGVFVLNAHQAKGKEFDTVVLADPIDVRHRTFGFPHKEPADRRLLYVVLTRAKSRVFIIPHERSQAFTGLFLKDGLLTDS